MIKQSHFYLHEYFKDDEKSEVIEYINNHLIPRSKDNRLMGILETHLQSGIYDMSLKLISHVITNINVIGNSVVVFEYKILNTSCGNEAKSFIDSGVCLHIRPRVNKYPNGEIANMCLDLAVGDKGDFREEQIDSLLGNKCAIREHKIYSILGN